MWVLFLLNNRKFYFPMCIRKKFAFEHNFWSDNFSLYKFTENYKFGLSQEHLNLYAEIFLSPKIMHEEGMIPLVPPRTISWEHDRGHVRMSCRKGRRHRCSWRGDLRRGQSCYTVGCQWMVWNEMTAIWRYWLRDRLTACYWRLWRCVGRWRWLGE